MKRDERLALTFLAREAGWISVHDLRRAWGQQTLMEVPLYDRLRRLLYRLARLKLAQVSPKGQPPGAGGLLFRISPAGRSLAEGGE